MRFWRDLSPRRRGIIQFFAGVVFGLSGFAISLVSDHDLWPYGLGILALIFVYGAVETVRPRR